MQAELDGDLDRTMSTMSPTPHLNHVPVLAGGYGAPAVREFYDKRLVGQFFPPDVVFTPCHARLTTTRSSMKSSSRSPTHERSTSCSPVLPPPANE